MPSSYPIAKFRRRSIEARGIRVSYKPHPGETLCPISGSTSTTTTAAAGPAAAPAVRAPSDSYLEVVLPFSTSPHLRDEVSGSGGAGLGLRGVVAHLNRGRCLRLGSGQTALS